MQPELKDDPAVAAAVIEACHFVLDRQHCPHCIGWIVEHRHHGVADGLDHSAPMPRHAFRKKSEVIAHEPIRRGIAKFIVKLGRALKIGEHDRYLADLDVVPRPQQLLGAKPPERGHRDYDFAGQGILGPIAVLNDEDKRPIGRVVDDAFVLVARNAQYDVGTVRGDFRKDTITADIRIRLVTCFNGAKAIRARR